MNHDKTAIYLNEHLEFFNDYPELLHKIREIDPGDLPLQPLKTLSVADRIIQRANADKENLKNRLDWFLEIAQANEQIQTHLHEIERLVITSTHLPQMIQQLCREVSERFDMPFVKVCLVADGKHFIDGDLRNQFSEELDGVLDFKDQATVSGWFLDGFKPVLHGEVNGDSFLFPQNGGDSVARSELLVPLVIRGAVAGAIGLASPNEGHFHEGLRTDFLERLADKLALAIDNILLLDLLKSRPVIDPVTGIYNHNFLEPILLREWDRTRRQKKPMSCVKMRIDYFNDLLDTESIEPGQKILKQTGDVLKSNSRVGDFLIRAEDGAEFVLLLPDIDSSAALAIADRIQKHLQKDVSADREIQAAFNLGVATFPGEDDRDARQLIDNASLALEQAVEKGRNQLVAL